MSEYPTGTIALATIAGERVLVMRRSPNEYGGNPFPWHAERPVNGWYAHPDEAVSDIQVLEVKR